MQADLVVLNARIRTMDPARPAADALAARSGRIVALGASADMRALAGPRAHVVDAGGRLVLPGLQDAHVHLCDGGTDLVSSAPLWTVRSISELQSALARHAAATRLPLVIGAGWQAGIFGDHSLTRPVLDAAVPDRPCIIYDSSFHNACLNSAACRIAGVVKGRPDPPNGHFVVEADGEPTGMLHEDAIQAVLPALPELTDAVRLDGLKAGQAHANRHGITGIIDPHVKEPHAAAYAALAREGDLTLRVSGAASISPEDSGASAGERLGALRAAHAGPDFWIQSAKLFLDGVLENRTAAMIAPYADGLGGNAPLMYPHDKIRELFVAIDALRFQIHVHVIGDMAVRAALDGFEAALAVNGRWPSLHQLAHLQVVHPDDIPRIAATGAMANIQTFWARRDPVVPDTWLDMVGPVRAPFVYAFRRMLDAGAAWCLSSDWPVSTLNPFEIMETAVTRQPLRHEGRMEPFFPVERLTVEEAVLGYTTGAAAACWRAGVTGQLRPGLSADLILLDRDIFAVPVHEIGATQVLLTLFKGREVWRDSSFSG